MFIGQTEVGRNLEIFAFGNGKDLNPQVKITQWWPCISVLDLNLAEMRKMDLWGFGITRELLIMRALIKREQAVT